MDFRVIPPRKKAPNKFDLEETYEIPVNVIDIYRERQKGRIIPITIERLDFKTGKLIKSSAITFQGSIELFDSMELELPFRTDCIVFKRGNEIGFKVIGIYNTGLWEKMNSVTDLLNNDEDEINKVFALHYEEINNWINE